MPPTEDTDAISSAGLLVELLRRWKLVAALLVLGAAAAAAYALTARPVFRAEVLATPAPVPGSQGLGASLGARVGGLSQLLGVSGDRDSRATLVATLGSLKLVRSFIAAGGPGTFAKDLYPNIHDANGALRPGETAPTELQLATRFRMRHLSVEDSKTTGLITVAVEWSDAARAAELANAYVAHANAVARRTANEETRRNLSYLRREFAQTEPVEIRQAIASLIESELSKAAVASIRTEFAYQVLDPATPPQLRIFPRRTLIVAIGAVAGAALGMVVALALTVIAQLRASPREPA
jgi:uncharacterized protein involved in exopolysaccharide biosynthesis